MLTLASIIEDASWAITFSDSDTELDAHAKIVLPLRRIEYENRKFNPNWELEFYMFASQMEQ